MKRFTELDEGFVCEKCHKEVKPLHYSNRYGDIAQMSSLHYKNNSNKCEL